MRVILFSQTSRQLDVDLAYVKWGLYSLNVSTEFEGYPVPLRHYYSYSQRVRKKDRQTETQIKGHIQAQEQEQTQPTGPDLAWSRLPCHCVCEGPHVTRDTGSSIESRWGLQKTSMCASEMSLCSLLTSLMHLRMNKLKMSLSSISCISW